MGLSRSLCVGRFKAPYHFSMVSQAVVALKHYVASLGHFKVTRRFYRSLQSDPKKHPCNRQQRFIRLICQATLTTTG